MPRYMTQFSYTAEAWKNLVANPEDRAKAVASLVEGMGGKLLDIYYTMGEHDGFIITEAPDDETVSAAILVAAATGHVKNIRTTKIFTMDETIDIMRRAGEQRYSPPKG